MKSPRLLLALGAMALACNLVTSCAFVGGKPAEAVVGTAYYLDAIGGDDANPGTKPNKAWKSLAAVNQRVFGPGDQILIKAGTTYTGQFKPQGSGAAGHPIRVEHLRPAAG